MRNFDSLTAQAHVSDLILLVVACMLKTDAICNTLYKQILGTDIDFPAVSVEVPPANICTRLGASQPAVTRRITTYSDGRKADAPQQ